MLTSLNQFSLAVKTQVNLVFARLTVALSNPRFFTLLEFHQYACVDSSAGEVVGHGVVVVVDVLYPIVGVDIVDAEDVERVNAQPDVLEVPACSGAVMPVLVVEQAVGHSNVHATVGRSLEDMLLASAVWRAEWKAVGICSLQAQFPAVGAREIVGEV